MTDVGDGRFQPSDLLRQVMVQELAIAPDGASVVYARRTIEDGHYRKRLWRVLYEGGRPERLTSAAASDGAPRFSPDGTKLLFLSDRSGEPRPWILPLAGGEPEALTGARAAPGKVTAAEWSPDSERVAFLAPSGERRLIVGPGSDDDPTARRITDLTWQLDGVGKRDQFTSLWVAGVSGTEARRVVGPGVEVSSPFWSPDGAEIGFLADRRPEAALMEEPQVWAVPASGGEPRRLAALAGAVIAAAWGRTGRLAVVGIDLAKSPEWANAGVFVVDDGNPRRLPVPDELTAVVATYGDLVDPDALAALAWDGGGDVVALASAAGACIPVRFDADGAPPERLVDDVDVVCSALAVAGDRVVVVATSGARPAEVYAVEDGALRPLTRSESRWFDPWRREPERHRVPHPDGHAVDAWLLPARGERHARPLVVHLHGGPHASHGPTPWLEMHALAGAGMHVVSPNPRGSVGYGEAFARALHGAWGDPDGSDVIAVVEWAVAAGLTAPGRIGVLGLSYGGYMVNWLLGHYPGRFAAGVSENPVTDMVGEFGSSDFGVVTDETAVGAGTLPEDIDEFLRRSPYLDIHRSDAPLLLLQSEDDLRCPPGQSQLVFTLLRARGAHVELVLYPAESHYLVGEGRPDRRVDRMERIVAWFERHLRAAR